MATIGKRIRRALDEMDMSQAELARRLGVTPLTVSNWVSDQNEPRGHNLKNLKRFLSPSSGSPTHKWVRGLTVGKGIRRALDEMDMSQAKLARRLGVTPLTVSNWVNGRNEPRGHNLKNLKRFLSPSSGRELDRVSGAGRHIHTLSKPSFQGGANHQNMQRRLYELGQIMELVVHTNRDIGGGHRPDVLWYKLDPETHQGAQPKNVFEIELGQAIQKSLATLKHAYDLGNADLFLLVPEDKLRIAQSKVNGAFHEIKKKLKVLSVEKCPENTLALKKFLGVCP